MAVSIVEFPKMNSSTTMAKLEMAKYFHLKWESALVKWEIMGEKKEVKGMAVSIVEFPKMNSSTIAKLERAINFI